MVCSPPLATLARPILAAWPRPHWRNSFFSRVASLERISTPACSFSQMRGTAKNSVGWTSRRLAVIVSIDSAKLSTRAARHEVPGREDPLGDVAQRQVGDDVVVRSGQLAAGQPVGEADDLADRELGVGVGDHRPLGRSGRAGRVHQRHHVGRQRGVDQRIDGAGVSGAVFAPEGEEVLPRREPVVVVALAARGVRRRRSCARSPNRRRSAASTLSTCSWSSARWTLAPQSPSRYSTSAAGLVGYRPTVIAADGDGGEVQDDPLGPVLGVDRHPVAGLDAECQQAVGGVDDEVPRAIPRVLLPDAEVLLPHGHLPRCPASPVPGARRHRWRARSCRARRGPCRSAPASSSVPPSK